MIYHQDCSFFKKQGGITIILYNFATEITK